LLPTFQLLETPLQRLANFNKNEGIWAKYKQLKHGIGANCLMLYQWHRKKLQDIN